MKAARSGTDLNVKARLLQVMEALECVGATPIAFRELHAFSYLANVLSPVWDILPLEGSVLKEAEGAYFPGLQRAIDECIAENLLTVQRIEPRENSDGSNGIEAYVKLTTTRAGSLLARISELPDMRNVTEFLVELAFAYFGSETKGGRDLVSVDAAWSDPAIDKDRVVDFAEYVSPTRQNPAWNTAQRFQDFAPEEITYNRAEKLAMYLQLLKRRAHG